MKKIKSILLVAVLLATTAFTLKTNTGYEVGDTIEDFSLKNIDDTMVSLSDYKNAKGFIVVFTCNMCPYSVANEDRLIALDKKYKEKGYPVIAINPNDPKASKGDSFEDMKVRAKEKGFTFPYLFDGTQEVAKNYGAVCTPDFFGYNNELELQYRGRIRELKNLKPVIKGDSDLITAMKLIVESGKGPKKQIPSMGCNIKWFN